MFSLFCFFFFFFNDTATTEIYTLSLHDALPIWRQDARRDTVAQLIADARFAVPREQAVLQDVPTSRKRRAAAARFTPTAAAQTRRLDHAVRIAPDGVDVRLLGAETAHVQAVSLVSRAFAPGTSATRRHQLLAGARGDLRTVDARLR